MRRGSSTVVALVGEIEEDLPDGVARSPNIAVVRAEQSSLEAAVAAFARATGTLAPYVVVTADPLAEVAEEWRRMWDPAAGADEFEVRAGIALAAWRAGRFELPDYYVVVAREREAVAAPHRHDLHLGVLRAERPARVVPVVAAEAPEASARVVHALARLKSGPWWPPVDALVERARSFFPGAVAG